MKYLAISALFIAPTVASAAYVTPKLGGAQQSAPMIMPAVKFDGTGLSISGLFDMMGNQITAIPVLRPLVAPDEFDPVAPYSVLTGKAYNLQYGWNFDATTEQLPAGLNVWITQTSATPGLAAYAHHTYTPIFGTNGSSSSWSWDGTMAHNAYAATPSWNGSYSASYSLYLADASGTPATAYSSTSITLTWTSIPEPAMVGLLTPCLILLGRRR